MDLNALMSTLLSEESINGVGEKAGASSEQVRGVLGSALPLLLNGANAQANDESTASGFAGALQQHAQSDTSNLSSFLGGVDLSDGAKIVAHLLGANTAAQTAQTKQNEADTAARTAQTKQSEANTAAQTAKDKQRKPKTPDPRSAIKALIARPRL